MLIFLYGSDAYRVKQARDNIIERYKAKYSSGINLFSFTLSDSNDFNQVEESLQNSSFFNEHKLITCKNAFGKKTSADKIAVIIKEYALSNSPDITLLVSEDSSEKDLISKHRDLFETLSDKKNTIKIVESLVGNNLNEWIKKEVEAQNRKISNTTIKNLIAIVGNDSWALICEINKLCAYVDKEITINDVRTLVTSKIDLNIFEFIDALAVKNRSKAIELLYCELKTGRDPYYILTMIIYQFRNILTAKDLRERGASESEISNKTKVHPFVIKKSLRSPFTAKESTQIFCKLLNLDTKFKTGGVNLEDSLYSIIK